MLKTYILYRNAFVVVFFVGSVGYRSFPRQHAKDMFRNRRGGHPVEVPQQERPSVDGSPSGAVIGRGTSAGAAIGRGFPYRLVWPSVEVSPIGWCGHRWRFLSWSGHRLTVPHQERPSVEVPQRERPSVEVPQQRHTKICFRQARPPVEVPQHTPHPDMFFHRHTGKPLPDVV